MTVMSDDQEDAAGNCSKSTNESATSSPVSPIAATDSSRIDNASSEQGYQELQATPEPAQPELSRASNDAPEKVTIHFNAVGNAPTLKKRKYMIRSDLSFSRILSFLRKNLLDLKAGDPLFIYCNSAFCPSPDQKVGELFLLFSRAGELQLNYHLQEAWG